jgi:hypothetical protein
MCICRLVGSTVLPPSSFLNRKTKKVDQWPRIDLKLTLLQIKPWVHGDMGGNCTALSAYVPVGNFHNNRNNVGVCSDRYGETVEENAVCWEGVAELQV